MRLLSVLAAVSAAVAISNGVARTPPLGVSSSCSSEAECTLLAAALVSSGLSKAGYNVLIVEKPCFAGRLGNGTLSSPAGWPNGFAAFVAGLHKQGLKFGIASSQGALTCDNCTGSAGFETLDMVFFAALGADFVEVCALLRRCSAPPREPPALVG